MTWRLESNVVMRDTMEFLEMLLDSFRFSGVLWYSQILGIFRTLCWGSLRFPGDSLWSSEIFCDSFIVSDILSDSMAFLTFFWTLWHPNQHIIFEMSSLRLYTSEYILFQAILRYFLWEVWISFWWFSFVNTPALLNWLHWSRDMKKHNPALLHHLLITSHNKRKTYFCCC